MADFGKIVLGLLAVAVICAVAYAGVWWLREDSVNRQTEINRDQFNYQQTLRDELVDQYDDILAVDTQITVVAEDTAAALTAQRAAMVDQLCSIASQITGELSFTHNEIIRKEC